jgi:hypothetical protein
MPEYVILLMSTCQSGAGKIQISSITMPPCLIIPSNIKIKNISSKLEKSLAIGDRG